MVPGGEGEGRRGGEDGDQSSRWRRFCFAAAALAPKSDSAHFLAAGGGCLQMGAGGGERVQGNFAGEGSGNNEFPFRPILSIKLS